MKRQQNADSGNRTSPGLSPWRRWQAQVMKYLESGISPEKNSLAIAVGATGGLFPIYGLTTLVSAILGVLLRANPVVVQIFNFMMYPIYFPIELAFIVAGAWLFEGNVDAYSIEGLRKVFAGGLASTVRQLGWALVHATMVWLAAAPLLTIALRAALLPIIRRWQRVGAAGS